MKRLLILFVLLTIVSISTQAQTQNLNNGDLQNVNTMTINDPGPSEGVRWINTSANWSLDVSPLNRANTDGNFNIYGTANNIVFWRPLSFYKTGPDLDNIDIISIAENTNNHFWLQGMFAGVGSTGNSLRFKSAWQDNVLFLRGNGNVGIGVDNPDYRLHVSTGESGEAILRVEADTDNNNENDNSRVELMQDGGLLGVYMGFNQAWGGPIADNLFRIGTRYSGVDNFKRFVIRTDNGFVGLGNDNPVNKLDITGDYTANHYDAQLHLHTTNNTYGMYMGSHSATYGAISQGSHYQSAGNYTARSSYASGIIQNNGFIHLFSNSGLSNGSVFSPNMRLSISNSGRVGIGTTSPDEMLEVNGNALIQGDIESMKVKVSQNPGNWPDYVFANDYKLRSLDEVQSFITKNHHLPEVPSAAEVEKNGIDLGNMDATLLKKVEELTLYMIEMKKEIEMLKSENKALKQEIKEKD